MRKVFVKTNDLIFFLKFILLIGFLNIVFFSMALASDILRLEIRGESSGTVDILLDKKSAPQHVERITLLTQEKKYDGVVFHRVIEGFMAQTGDVQFGNMASFDPNLVGMGGSNYPALEEEFSNGQFIRGTVGMARSRDMNSANSQFFIMFEPAPHLDNKYTIIGQVIRGMGVVLGIKKGQVIANGSVESPDYILSAKIITEEK